MDQNTEDVYRKLASVLEEVASRSEKGSEEETSIRKAAWALNYIFIRNHWEQFEDFIIKNETPPTPEETDRMHEHLRRMGIDPNSH